MLFNSIEFLLFFPIVTALYFLLPHRFRWVLLLAASCLFYMAFVPAYILILAVTIVVDYVAGILIEQAEGKRRKTLLIVSIVSNVGFLFFFKYYNFAADNLNHFAHLIHWNYTVPALRILLPIGLSFHTFQAMSYTIEVYRRRQPAERHFGIYALYVMFYPQLVAGPIERPQNLLPQFRKEHQFDYTRITHGLQRMLWGMFKKVVIADNLAVIVDRVYDDPHHQTGLSFIIATVFFAQQIYCDFSGYADIALGAAQVMGFKLMENFNRPYFAKSIAEFWTRWHISLSTWFKDYLYIPLGGNRVSVGRWYFNLMFVFLISGIWHGARWTFVVWGALHGLYLLVSIMTAGARKAVAAGLRLDAAPRLYRVVQISVTTFLVVVAWVFFRANSVPDAIYILKHCVTGLLEVGSRLAHQHHFNKTWLGVGAFQTGFCILLVVFLEGVHLIQRGRSIRQTVAGWPIWLRWSVYQSLILATCLMGRLDAQQFIYFQF